MYTARSTKTAQGGFLTPAEQELYLSLLPRRLATVKDAARILGNYDTARSLLWRLGRKGYVQRVRGGLYVLVPPELRGKEVVADPYLLASRAARGPHFLSYHTALELHGLAQSPLAVTFASVRRRRAPFAYQGTTYRFVLERRLFGTKEIVHAGATLPVSDLERTVLDCVRRLELAGGLEETLKSFQGLPYLDPRRTLAYADRFGTTSLCHRAGFLLSLVQDGARVPEELLAGLKERLGKRTYHLLPRTRGGRYVSEWRLVVPRNVEGLLRGA
jgi:predicted transcriptional regulator of viral defense system